MRSTLMAAPDARMLTNPMLRRLPPRPLRPVKPTPCPAEYPLRMTRHLRLFLAAAALVLAPHALGALDLHAAVRSGDAARVREAIALGAAIDAPDAWGRTPLIVALQSKKP